MDRPLARRVWVAVNSAERRICCDAAVRSSAVAEGLALTGRRAARFVDRDRDESARGSIAVPWVDHRVLRPDATASGAPAFELLAATGQDAVDHCLVAHRMAAKLGRPGLCSLDPALADSVALLELPQADWIADLPTVNPPPTERAGSASILAAADAAFASIAGATGRSLLPVSRQSLDGARYVLVTAGSTAGLAASAAQSLRRSGVPCGAVAFALVDPLPDDVLLELVNAREIVVLSRGDDPLADRLARRAESALGAAGPAIGLFEPGDLDADGLAAALASRWNVELSAPNAAVAVERSPFSIGALPAGRWMEELLLDTVAGVASPGEGRLDLNAVGPAELVTLSLGGRTSKERPVDLLFVADPAALVGVAGLERVCERGALLVRAATEDPRIFWTSLTEEQRATIILRRLRTSLVAPDSPGRASLQGAILAAAPAIAQAIPVDDDRLREAMRLGATARIEFEPTRLGEPYEAVAESDRLRLPSAAESDADLRALGERLRQFHFTACDSVTEGDAASLTLRPALLRALSESTAARQTERSSLFGAWSRTVLTNRRRCREESAAESRSLADRLRRTLGLPSSTGPDDLAARLGEVGAEYVDLDALSNLAGRGRGGDLSDARRQRLSDTLAALEQVVERHSRRPAAYVVCPRNSSLDSDAGDLEIVRHADGLRTAVGISDGLAHEAIRFARALRTARLEVAGKFDEAVHGPILDRLDRPSLTTAELFLFPPVVVLETAEHLRGPALAAFSELIRAGRPIHVLVEERLAEQDAASAERAGYHPGLGYLAVAHREALVVQSSVGRPEHLAAGLERAANALDPVVVLSAVARSASPSVATDQLEAAVQGRATPCFTYDPAGGSSWAERFTLDQNPQPERLWPSYPLELTCADGREETLWQSFTFAHAAALDPAWRTHFLPIGAGAWLVDQIEVAEYLELTDRARSARVPYIWIEQDGVMTRALLSWELAFACIDRMRAWRILQELAGTENAYARRAADEARQAAREEADQRIESLESDFAVALATARSGGAANAVERLVGLLASPQGLSAQIATFSTAPPAAQAVLEEAPPAAEPPQQTSAAPYIDSFLCTTCNDCTNLNPRMFRYNENKQAEIADPAAGTFQQLVKAAEACPARCIHPGAPAVGDKTATPALIARAAKFD